MTRVTRVTTAIAEAASAIAGSVRWWRRSTNPEPVPIAGNQPSPTANTASSTIAATNDGTAARIVVAVTIVESRAPRRRPATTPSPTPNTMIRTAA